MSITYCASELEQKRVKGSDFRVVLVFFFGSFPNNDNLTVVVSLCERRFDGWYGAICGKHEFWVGWPQLKSQQVRSSLKCICSFHTRRYLEGR